MSHSALPVLSIRAVAFALALGVPAAMAAVPAPIDVSAREYASCQARNRWSGCVREKTILTVPGIGRFAGRCEQDPVTRKASAVLRLQRADGTAMTVEPKPVRAAFAGRPRFAEAGAWLVHRADGARQVRVVGEASVLRSNGDAAANPQCLFQVQVREDRGPARAGSALRSIAP
ncbi:MAG TPA: hypothetical protein VJM11_05435 [Nevskiaceae bacterium]|nr:hypothetical protein [Nevskiaceae bacterium]